MTSVRPHPAKPPKSSGSAKTDGKIDPRLDTRLGPRLIVALDFDSQKSCLDLVKQLDPKHCRLKVGKEMFTYFGPKLVDQLQSMGFEVFLDLKFHDIPNTVAKAVSAAASLGVWMVNVHAFGGIRMMEAAKESLSKFSSAPKLIAVTVLTSMSAEDLREIGISMSPAEGVEHLAGIAAGAGLDGVVCSAREAARVKQVCGSDFMTITPGIRPQSSLADDQRRIVTPTDAIRGGSDYLVMGRPITQAKDPLAVLQQITKDVQSEAVS